MTPRERYLAALVGEMPDRLPLIIWNNKLPGGEKNTRLRELEVLIINKSSVYVQHHIGPGIESYSENDVNGERKKIIYTTPHGVLTKTEIVMPGTVWITEHPFKNPDDYAALESLISSREYEPDYHRFLEDDTELDGQTIARPITIRSPMQELIYEFMGIEAFSIEWAENRSKMIHLLDVLKEDWLKRVKITADSPARFAVVEGNPQLSIIGLERFENYYAPCIEQACDILHQKGKIVGAHLDGDNKNLAPLIVPLPLDFIESFTPPPDCDLSISEARNIWPDMSLQIHFPSSIHLSGFDEVRSAAIEILRQAAPGNRFIMGSMEDIPAGKEDSLVYLYEVLRENGRLPLTI